MKVTQLYCLKKKKTKPTPKTPPHRVCYQSSLTAGSDRPEGRTACNMEREPMRIREGYLVKKVSRQPWTGWRRELTEQDGEV